MSVEKAATTKRTTKKVVTPTEAAKPTKSKAGAKTQGTASGKPSSSKKAVVAQAPSKVATKAATTKSAVAAKKTVSHAITVKEKPSAPSHEERQRWIATAAYHRAEKRGFAPGYEMLDWLHAEAEIKGMIGST